MTAAPKPRIVPSRETLLMRGGYVGGESGIKVARQPGRFFVARLFSKRLLCPKVLTSTQFSNQPFPQRAEILFPCRPESALEFSGIQLNDPTLRRPPKRV